jgi:hypothetical protein
MPSCEPSAVRLPAALSSEKHAATLGELLEQWWLCESAWGDGEARAPDPFGPE